MFMSKDPYIIDYHSLRKLLLLQNLPPASLKKLAAENPCQRINAGRIIFRRGQTDDAVFYLIQGKVALSDHEHNEVVSAGSSAARVPLDNHQPRRFTAKAVTDAIIFKLNHNLIDVITAKESSADDINVSEIHEDDSQVDNQLMYKLYQEYMNGELKLASLPELAIRVRKAVQNQQKTANDIATIIQSDPAITGQLIKISNSPLYRTDATIMDCQTAIARIGLENTRDIVTSLSIRQLFKPKTKLVARQMSSLWKHSTQVAAIASVIANMLPAMKPDRALLAGLIHDIGILAILSYAEQFPRLLKSPDMLQQTINNLRGHMGALVLRNWSMPSDLVTVTLEVENWTRNSEHGPDLCDVVQVAQVYSFIGTAEQKSVPALFELPAFSKLPLSRHGHEKGLEILQEAREQIQDMKHLLI
jgi:HD-like signal output (HDOD) protein